MRLFARLSEELERQGLRGHVYLVGGAALIAGYGRARTTRDVDARIEDAKEQVLAVADRIGADEGLKRNWLNENARLFMTNTPDTAAKTIWNTPGLVVTGASAEHLLAMKMLAGRPADLEDITHLGGVLGIRRVSQAEAIYEQVYRGGPLPEARLHSVGWALAEGRKQRGESVERLQLAPSERLRVRGGGGRTYEARPGENAQGDKFLEVAVIDPERAADEENDPRSVRLYDRTEHIVTTSQATEVINRYEAEAIGRERGQPQPQGLKLEGSTVLVAEGEEGRQYEAEWIDGSDEGPALHVTVKDPSVPHEDHRNRPRVLLDPENRRVIRNVERANEAVNAYEKAASEERWPGMAGRPRVSQGGKRARRQTYDDSS